MAVADVDIEIVNAVGDLERSLCALGDRLLSGADAVSNVVVVKVPLITDGKLPDRIEPDIIEGREALEMASSAWGQLKYLESQSAGTTYRCPGVVAIPDRDFYNEIVAQISDINSEKGRLKKALEEAFPSTHTRWRWANRHLKRYCMYQVYRQLHVIDNALRVGFYWTHSGNGSQRITKEKAIQKLDEYVGDEDARTIAMNAIASMPDNTQKLVLRKPVAPHVRANLKHLDGTTRTINANLPLTVFDHGGADRITWAEPSVYIAKVRKKKRTDTVEYIPLHHGSLIHIAAE